MTDLLHVSLGELARAAADPLRVLGFPFGQAERGAEMLVWGEAVHGLGLAYLRRRGDAIADALPRSAGLRGPETARRLDAAGKSLLEIGPAALDLACAAARRHGMAMLAVADCRGLFLLGELALRAAAREVAAIIRYRAPPGDPFEGSGVLAALPGPTARFRDRAQAPAPGWAPGLLEASPAAALARGLADGAVSGDTAAPGFDLLAIDARPLPAAALAAATAALDAAPPGGAGAPWQGIADPAARRGAALARGLECDSEDIRHFWRLAARIRLPTSERSRSQAG